MPTRQFITSGNATQTVPDYSIFRQLFVDALAGKADEDNDGYILGSELAKYLKREVTNFSKRSQTPQFGKIQNYNLSRGDFVFVSPLTQQNATVTNSSNETNRIENEFWEAIKNTNDVENFKLYKEKYPNGIYVNLADLKIRSLSTFQPIAGKKFAQMSEAERFTFINNEANRIVRLLGEQSANSILPEGLSLIQASIQKYLDNTKPTSEINCVSGDYSHNLYLILKCGEKVAPDITKIFISKGITPLVGLYLAMIESEYKNCYISEYKALGMFQITFALGQESFEPTDNIVKGSTPESPDDRCNYLKAAKATTTAIQKITIPYLERKKYSPPTNWLFVVSAWSSGQGSLGKSVDTT